MIYEVDLSTLYDFKNVLLASAWPLQILEIPPLIVLLMNWFSSISKINCKLILVNLAIASQVWSGVDT